MIGGTNKRTMILLLLLVAVSAIAYPMLRGDSATTAEDTELQDGVASDEVLSILTVLQSINLDTTVLSNKTFNSLLDFTMPLPVMSLGRLNPFATLGR